MAFYRLLKKILGYLTVDGKYIWNGGHREIASPHQFVDTTVATVLMWK